MVVLDARNLTPNPFPGGKGNRKKSDVRGPARCYRTYRRIGITTYVYC
jgi:hypothetical protein